MFHHNSNDKSFDCTDDLACAQIRKCSGKIIHFDIQINGYSQSWNATKLQSVATHEFGHALGLSHCRSTHTKAECAKKRGPGHSDPPDTAVMHTYANNETTLQPDDIAGIQSLYGPRSTYMEHFGSHTCAVKNRNVYCWGRNDFGQLGDGTTDDKNHAVYVDIGTDIISVAVGVYHTCAVKIEHDVSTVHCWGRNDFGQLGDGTTADRNYVVYLQDSLLFSDIDNRNIISIAVGSYHNCIVHATINDNAISCWGRNDIGQLGDKRLVDIGYPKLTVRSRLRSSVVTGINPILDIQIGSYVYGP